MIGRSGSGFNGRCIIRPSRSMRHCAQPVGTIVKPQATPFQGTKIPNIISTTCRRHFPCRSNTQCEGRALEDHPLIEDVPQPPAGPQQLPCQRKSKWRGSILETSSRAIISTSLAYLKKALYHTRRSGQDVVQLVGSILEREPAVRGCQEVRVPDGQVGPRPTVLSNQVRKCPAKRSRSIKSDSHQGMGAS